MMDAGNKAASSQPVRRSFPVRNVTSSSKTVGISQPSTAASTSLVSIRNNIFATRPLDPKIVSYCTNDVTYLPALYDLYNKRIEAAWRQKAMTESAKRVEEACSPSYEPHSDRKKFGPWAATATTKMSANSNYAARSTTRDDGAELQRFLDALDDHYMEERAKDIFGDPDQEALEDYFLEERAKQTFGDPDEEALEDYFLEERAKEICGDRYDDGDYDDGFDDYWPENSRDAAWDDTFDSCWEK